MSRNISRALVALFSLAIPCCALAEANLHILSQEGSSTFLEGTPIGYGTNLVKLERAGEYECKIVHPDGRESNYLVSVPAGEAVDLLIDTTRPEPERAPEPLPAPADGVQLEGAPSSRQFARAEDGSRPHRRGKRRPQVSESGYENDYERVGYEYEERPRKRRFIQADRGQSGYYDRRRFYNRYYDRQPAFGGYYGAPRLYPGYQHAYYQQQMAPARRRSNGIRNVGLGLAAIGLATGNRKLAGFGALVGLFGSR